MFPAFCPPTTWAISLESCGKPCISGGQPFFLSMLLRSDAPPPGKLWALLSPQVGFQVDFCQCPGMGPKLPKVGKKWVSPIRQRAPNPPEFVQPSLSRSNGIERGHIWVCLLLYRWSYPGVRLQIWVCLICVMSPQSNGPVRILRSTRSTAGNSMTGSERPSPELLLKKEASPAVLGGILEMLWSLQMP